MTGRLDNSEGRMPHSPTDFLSLSLPEGCSFEITVNQMCFSVRETVAVSVLSDEPSHNTFKNQSVHINLSNWESNKRQRYKSLIFSNVGTCVEKFYCSQGLY